MDWDLQQAARPLLDGNENLLWVGRPRQGVFFRGSDLAVVPFSLLWCGFAIFWTVMAFRETAPGDGAVTEPREGMALFMPLWGLMFVAIGLYFVFGRFFADALRRKTTLYALTDRRVLIQTGSRGRTVRSFDLTALPSLSLTEHPDGTGSVSFISDAVPGAYSGRAAWTAIQAQSGFERVKDAKSVFAQIGEARKSALAKVR